MPVYTTIAASSSASISLPAGSTLELTGSGTAQVVPPAPVPGDAAARTLGSGDVTFGPYSRACTVNVVAGAVAVRYFVAAAADAFVPAAGGGAVGPLSVDAAQALVSEAWMSPALQALIGIAPTRIYLDSTPLLLDNSPIFN